MDKKTGNTETDIFEKIKRDDKGGGTQSSPLKNAPISQRPVSADELDGKLTELQQHIRNVNNQWLGLKPKKR
jgi:hypothetical protein